MHLGEELYGGEELHADDPEYEQHKREEQCDVYLRYKFTTKLQRAIWVNGGQVREEVVFHCFQRYFCCINTVVVGLNELYFCFVGLNVCFDGAGAFIIQYV